MTAFGKGRGQCGLTDAGGADQRDGAVAGSERARVETRDAAKSKRECQDRAEQIRGDVVQGPRFRPARPDLGAWPVDDELYAVTIPEPEEPAAVQLRDRQERMAGFVLVGTHVQEFL